MDELLEELQALLDKYGDNEPAGETEEEQKDIERINQICDELETRKAERAVAKQSRVAVIANARKAIESGEARKVDALPLARAANNGVAAYDTTDYAGASRRAWVKDIATRGGIELAGGNELSDVERRAFTHLTSNTGSVTPVEVKNEIISLIEGSAVLYGDVRKEGFKHQFELPRHKSIKAGDAAKTKEGEAPADEQNEFDSITLTGVEIKKTVKLSRKMAVQSLEGFEQYLINETAGRLSVAANAHVVTRFGETELGILAANKINAAKAGTLTKADLVKMFALLKTFSNPVPKGCVIYSNANTIWNHIAMIEDANKRSYFVDEKTEDPAIQGRIFGKTVKQEDALADGVILAGYPDLFRGNVFEGPDITPYIATDGTQNHCFDGYLLFDGGLAVPHGFSQLTIGASA